MYERGPFTLRAEYFHAFADTVDLSSGYVEASYRLGRHWQVAGLYDGRPVAVIDQERGSSPRQAFSRDIHQKDADAVAAYWQTAVFSGRDVPPPIGKSDAEALAFVRANPGAIGYVSGTADVQGVRVLALR
jgi:hypothetical protein